jgi:hypothetical protein
MTDHRAIFVPDDPQSPNIPPGYTVRNFDNEKYIVPNFAVEGLEELLATRQEREGLAVESRPATVRIKNCTACRCQSTL